MSALQHASASPAPALMRVRALVRHFPGKRQIGKEAMPVRAVDGVDFDLFKGETLGIVGESGCGKSTTARLIMGLDRPNAGSIDFEGRVLGSPELPLRRYWRDAQMVFQDSYSSLNPRMTIESSLTFAPRAQGVSARIATEKAHALLHRVGLEPSRFAARYPHELSGGQRQRVNIARAIIIEPKLIVLDEAVSALDKSVEAQILNLLLDLKQEFGLTYVFISHDLNVVRFICDRVLVMYLGRVCEAGSAARVLGAPAHPYAEALLASMPSLDPRHRTSKAPLAGDPPSPIAPPPGCRFNPRCSLAEEPCRRDVPQLEPVAAQHDVACLARQAGSGHSLAQERVGA
ncbi:ABC transporter ATP-binding protein [Bosea sp. (in: a-proteobacteria)]|uniref:ABC transporter ATP-binding protein n=1 Tax=Bosea sp. (in: a-proteobacteria) TaxID=1871050 RepID=UPI00262121B3|nr:ABC transporter ATP-binding protein [Bosea sp. (in: a-proteobacteria)]MCO5089517.1 ABC transporter ATP-binding protein [Bosea sp. (in: a-proteobacteria)]